MKNNKIIWAIFFACLVTFFLIIFYLMPKSEIIYNTGYENDAPQHLQYVNKYNKFVEWWYFDGHINANLSFILTFWISSNGDWAELTIYDNIKEKKEVYHEDFIKNKVLFSEKKCEIKMGNSSVLEKNGVYSIIFNNRDCKFQFELTPLIGGFENQLSIPLENFSFKPWVVAVPRGKINGTLEYKGNKIKFDGIGYHDHNYFPQLKFFPFKMKDWYWGRFFTKNYTIIMAVIGLSDIKHSSFFIFKNGDLIQATANRNIFSNKDYKRMCHGQMPSIVDVKFSGGCLSILNQKISRKTQYYTRYVNKFKIQIFNGKNEPIEEGVGLSELVR